MGISVIIPTYNEETTIAEVLSVLKDYRTGVDEIIVVDGSSTDATVSIARSFKVTVLKSDYARRSFQLDLGARVAGGEILYFLHADTLPPKDFIGDIESAVDAGDLAGCFRLKFKPSSSFLRFFEVFVGLPWLVCRGGDQSLFITRELYKSIGGFNVALHIMEDIEIIRRIKKKTHFRILQSRVFTSSRRYIKYGERKLQWAFTLVHLRYWLGMDSKRIKLKLDNYLNNERI